MGVCRGRQTLGHRVRGLEASRDERSDSGEAGQEGSAGGHP